MVPVHLTIDDAKTEGLDAVGLLHRPMQQYEAEGCMHLPALPKQAGDIYLGADAEERVVESAEKTEGIPSFPRFRIKDVECIFHDHPNVCRLNIPINIG